MNRDANFTVASGCKLSGLMISVIIPAYNQARYLPQAVESVWAQTLTSSEIILVDDGSTDATETVVQELAERGPLTGLRQPNAGPAAARNRGIRESHGDWIAFLDADDYWLPGKLEAQLTLLEKSDSDFAYCGSVVVDDLGTPLAYRQAAPSDCLLQDLPWGNRLATPTVIAKRSLLGLTGLFDESLSFGEDWDLWMRLAVYGRAACIPEPLVAVRFSEWDAKGYSLQSYEASLLHILSRFFSLVSNQERLAFIAGKRRLILSWHLAVLAKSFFRHRKFTRFLFYAARCFQSHPSGIRYLLPKSTRPVLISCP